MGRDDVVVVGGGVVGLSVALHLVEMGVPKARLVERDGLFQGTSGAGAGFVTVWAVSVPSQGSHEAALARYGLEFYAGLQADGYDIGFRQHGCLWVAGSDEAKQGLRGMAGHALEPEAVETDPGQVAELTGGLVRSDRISGGVFQPSGARVHAPKVGQALAERFVARGGVVETRTPVTGVRTHGGRIVGLDTAHGPLACDAAVVAAGAWSNTLLKPTGAYLPTVPQVASRITTGPLDVPGEMPTLFLTGLQPDLTGLPPEPGGQANERSTRLWVREHEGGLVFGGAYRRSVREMFVDSPLPERFDEVPIDGVLECQRRAEYASKFMPALGRATTIRVKHGTPCYTPDGRPLVGSVPGIDGLYTVAGDNEFGITYGPGLGKALAELISDPRGELDWVERWRVDRFGDRFRSHADVVDGVRRVRRA